MSPPTPARRVLVPGRVRRQPARPAAPPRRACGADGAARGPRRRPRYGHDRARGRCSSPPSSARGSSWHACSRRTQAWQDSTQQWETLARTTGEELATAQADLAATQAELDATTAQLATAQERITQLADEKAQLGDTSASQQQLADYQSRVSQAAGQVATALASCVDGQQRLIGYLQDSAQYDQDDLARFTADVQTVCAQATDANAALQRELER